MARRPPTTGELDFEIQFCEGVLAKNPKFLQALILLGDLYTRRGFFEKGLAVDERLALLLPEDPVVFYNLACSYSLVRRMDEALVAIKTAVALGYDDFEHLRRDSDLTNLFKDSRFKDYLTQLKGQRVPLKNP